MPEPTPGRAGRPPLAVGAAVAVALGVLLRVRAVRARRRTVTGRAGRLADKLQSVADRR